MALFASPRATSSATSSSRGLNPAGEVRRGGRAAPNATPTVSGSELSKLVQLTELHILDPP